MFNKSIVWLRRDLRLKDNRALVEAARVSKEVQLVFVFDDNILKKLPKKDRRITFIIESLLDLQEQLIKQGSNIIILKGDPKVEILKIMKDYDAIFANKDYEPLAKSRDSFISSKLENFFMYKDHVVMESDEVKKDDGEYYKVFTPYKRKWIENLDEHHFQEFSCKIKYASNKKLYNRKNLFELINFQDTPDNIIKGGEKNAEKMFIDFLENKINKYDKTRDEVSIDGTSNLGIHFRFGTISIRKVLRAILNRDDSGTAVWLSELIWRDFYQTILDLNPRIANESFKSKYNEFQWENDRELFEKWKKGETGFLLIDAAMKCLNKTGFMHNRLRMLCANFLCKILLIDWRWGEKYFAEKLLDYDMAANNGGWQWSSGTGCDAQPYFRIFRPESQEKKYDSEHKFINKWVSDMKIKPCVDYKERRKYALDKFKEFNS